MNEPSRVRARGFLGVTFTLALVLEACSGTTGGEVIAFRAAASGLVTWPRRSSRRTIAGGRSATAATLHVGAIYLNQTVKVSGAQGTGCILPGTYVAQVTTGRDVDLLSPEPQPFPALGEGNTLPALAGQVWLTGGPIDRVDDPTPILHVEGVAEAGGAVRPFSGTMTIGSNRDVTDGDSVQAGASLICNSRIVSPIRTSIALDPVGMLLVRVDPRLVYQTSISGRYQLQGRASCSLTTKTPKTNRAAICTSIYAQQVGPIPLNGSPRPGAALSARFS